MNDLPSRMTAVAIREPGGPEVLIAEERSVPVPGEHEILLRVAAAGVNRPDVLQRKGHYPPPKGASDLPGLEVAGTVVTLGRGVTRWSIGDRVIALLPGGGYAEYCTVHETNALPLPGRLSMVQGAGVPETTFTVWHNVFERGGLRPGQTALIHGGTSGIGTTAILLGKAFGARMIVTCGTDEKCEAALRVGADRAVNYRTEDFVAAVGEETSGRGADMILDCVGGDYVERNYDAAAEDGRIVQIAFQNGPVGKADLRKLMTKRLTHTGSTLRARPIAFKAELARTLRETVWPLIEEGRFAPVIDSTFGFQDASSAHERMERGEHVGKIILTVGEQPTNGS